MIYCSFKVLHKKDVKISSILLNIIMKLCLEAVEMFVLFSQVMVC